MRIYAVSDIHGYSRQLDVTLSMIDMSGDNKLVLLGDYIHGPDGYGVLDRIIRLQEKYGPDKVVALLGNHEEMALDGLWPIGAHRFGDDKKYQKKDKDEKYLLWMSKLPRYYVVKNTIFVHAGIDEYAASDGLWELGTCEHIFTCKYPAQTGRIENFNMKIVAGHIGTHCIAHNPHYHDIFYDGENHYYIDGSVGKSKRLPILMYDTDRDKYYRITESGPWLILPYYDEN
jgi:serine/threonine protein phosphatase 1